MIRALLLVLAFATSLPAQWATYVTTYGADPTGKNDSLKGVIDAMAAACSKHSGIVLFPSGKFTFSGILPNVGCNGLTLKGAGVQATELDFPMGSGYAITELDGTSESNNLRNFTIQGFLIVVGGGSAGTNLNLGGIHVGNYAFTHRYQDIYIIGPTASTAVGISTNGDAFVSSLELDNVRVDNFGGTGGEGFLFTASSAGDLLHCKFCYSTGAYNGIEVSFFFTSILESSDVDNSTHLGFYLHPGTGNTITGIGLSGEVNKGNLYEIYGNAAATVGGSVVLIAPKSSAHAATTATQYPINITNFAGDVTIIAPSTVSTTGSAASLNINNSPHSVIVMGCAGQLDKGFSASATTFLAKSSQNICSN